MKLKVFKKKIETIIFKRNFDKNKYVVFFSNIHDNILNFESYNILSYSLKHMLQQKLSKFLINNFLKLSFFFNINKLNSFIKNLKTHINLIYFIKIKNLYFFNFSSNFKNSFKNININAFNFVLRLQKLFLSWFLHLKLVVKKFNN